jgi:type I restriction enzyme M protein
LSDKDIATISDTYHNWREKNAETAYNDIAGFCKSATIEDVRKNNYIITPGRYIDFKEAEDDGIGFDDNMKKLTKTLKTQMEKANELDIAIKENLIKIGFTL